jgi:hypothetical protein
MKLYGVFDTGSAAASSVTIDGKKFNAAPQVKPYLGKFKKGELYFIDVTDNTVTFMTPYDQVKHIGASRIAEYVASSVTDASSDVESKMALKERAIIWEHHMTVALGIVQSFGSTYTDINDYTREVVQTTAILYRCTMDKLGGESPISIFFGDEDAPE